MANTGTHSSAAVPQVQIVIDTGPLLCFGFINGGVRILTQRYHLRLRWAKAVFDEIAHCASKPNRAHAQAAQRWRGKDGQRLGQPISISNRGDVANVHAQVQAESVRLRGITAPQQLGRDQGESETLVLARDCGGYALINERPATNVGRRMRIGVYNVVDVLVAEFQAGRLETRQVRAMYDQLRSANLDGGAVLPDRFNASVLHKWSTPAPE